MPEIVAKRNLVKHLFDRSALTHVHQQCARPNWHLGGGARLSPPAFPALPLVALLLPALLQALVDLLRLPRLKVVQRAARVHSQLMEDIQ